MATLWYGGCAKTGAKLLLPSDRVLVICSGPSAHDLWGVSTKPTRIAFVAVGQGCRHSPFDVFVGMNHPANYVPMFRPPILYSERFSHIEPFQSNPFVIFVRNSERLAGPMNLSTLREMAKTRGYLWHGHSLVTALHVLIVAGAKELYLVGIEPEPEMFVDRYSDAFEGVRLLVEGLKGEIAIHSCSPLSPFNQFVPYRSIFELLDLPSHLGPVRPWEDKKQPFGILTGCDAAEEFILPWWLANLRRYNPEMPVVVADFGMTPDAVAEVVKKGCGVMPVRGNVVNPWFFKPGAIAAAPFNTVLWLDLDVEVRGSLDELVSLQDARIALGRNALGETRYQAGVCAVRSTDPLVVLWHEAVRHSQRENDQMLLDSVLSTLELKPRVLDERWNWVVHEPLGRRYDNVPPDTVCVHHIGPVGKERIRALITSRAGEHHD